MLDLNPSIRLHLLMTAARLTTTVVATMLALVLWISWAQAGQPADCVQCHSDKAAGKTIHPALDMGCDSCHSGVDASAIPHKFDGNKGLMAQGNELCLMCHDAAEFSGKARHAALEMGCTTCHTPHNSDNARLLLTPEPELCKGCHDNGMFDKKTVHDAVNIGCTPCHNPHASDKARLLKSDPPELCYTCHDQSLFYGPTIHSPVGEGQCLSCHLPHASDTPALTTVKTEELCYQCHDKNEFKGKQSTHNPVMTGKCLSCHMPHVSQNESLLLRRGNMLCRRCHPEIEKNPHTVAGFSAPGHPVYSKRDRARPGKLHTCLSCHMPHKSDSPHLFRYKGQSAFDLCGYCHKNMF